MSRGKGRVERAIRAALEAASQDTVLSVADLCARVYGIEPATVNKRHRVAVLRAFGQEQKGWQLNTSFRPARIHHLSNPQRIWEVQITRSGVLWDEVALAGLTQTKVRIFYRGETVVLNRARVAYGVVYRRGVAFTASRRGLVAFMFDQEWRARYATRGKRMPIALEGGVRGAQAGQGLHAGGGKGCLPARSQESAS
jgi:hypothetical protein